VLLLIETLRRDHVGCYGYARDTTPFIDRLAAEGLVFEDAIAQSSWTLPSVASLFTSLYPAQFAPRHYHDEKGERLPPQRLSDELHTLAEILRENGYRTISVATNALNHDEINLMQGFDTRRFAMLANAEWVVDEAIAQLDSYTEGATSETVPLFLYLHFMDVHLPYEPPPPYDTLFPTLDGGPHKPAHHRFQLFPRAEGLESAEFRGFRSHTLALYDGSLRFVDAQVERLVDHLKQRGLYAAAVLVVASDHGESMWDRPQREKELGLHSFLKRDHFGIGHGQSLFPELIEVPLIFHGRGVPCGRAQEQVRNVDLAPTLLAVAGVAQEGMPSVGGDLVESWRRGELKTRLALSETRTEAAFQRAIQDKAYQYMRLDGRELLLDRKSPELMDVSAERPELVARYRRELDAILEGLVPIEGAAATVDAELREALEALGYLLPKSTDRAP
jgi:arylsulfatase A-like enzyme